MNNGENVNLAAMIKATIAGLLLYWVFGPIGVAIYVLVKLYQLIKKNEIKT